MIKGAFKQRMVGAIFILSLGVILIPVILDTPAEDTQPYYSVKPDSPDLPEVSEASKISYVFNEIESIAPVVSQEKAAVIIAKVEPNLQPQPKPVAVSIPASTPVSIQGEWTIQLGAFSSTENANELLQRLSQKGFESYLKTTPGKKLVRVFVAPGVQKEKAQALQAKLDSQFGIKGILVRYQEP